MKSDSGTIFELHRFSLHDGPGIRTTIFFKGCSLKCTWCHNPESQAFKPQLYFNAEACINCFKCLEACPNGVHKIVSERHVVERDRCETAGRCVEVCSTNALKLIGYEVPVSKIISEIKKDIKFYNKSRGGVTISGGEPLAQFHFLKELLMALKKEKVHTAVDTCGFAKREYYEEILPYTDLFLFDYKLTDPAEHKAQTGKDNKLILSNLDFLYHSGVPIILRCPVIPGINDNDDHFKGIKELIKKYPELNIELLPFHNMGRDKASRIGRTYQFAELKEPDELAKQRWINIFKTENCNVICR